jgi:hypothetical protein
MIERIKALPYDPAEIDEREAYLPAEEELFPEIKYRPNKNDDFVLVKERGFHTMVRNYKLKPLSRI